MKYDADINHRRSIRLKGYDYSGEGLYFITACTYNRLSLFGEITNGEMILNNAGWMVEKYWLEITRHYPDAVLHEYIVMPNHVHGIIEMKSDNNATLKSISTDHPAVDRFHCTRIQNWGDKMVS